MHFLLRLFHLSTGCRVDIVEQKIHFGVFGRVVGEINRSRGVGKALSRATRVRVSGVSHVSVQSPLAGLKLKI